MPNPDAKALLEKGLTRAQWEAVRSKKRRMLVIAGAGSGKTEVMARRVAWWVAVEGVPKSSIVAFTFTERAAEEMKFRIREWIGRVSPEGEDPTLGDMYIGTIHGFCIRQLRELAPDEYHAYDILDECAKVALINRGFHNVLGLAALKAAIPGKTPASQSATIDRFVEGYDLLNEYGLLDVQLADGPIPRDPRAETEWCKAAQLKTRVGKGEIAKAFAMAAGRYYAYLRARRFLDFSTSQSELLRLLSKRADILAQSRKERTHFVVDEVQDINPVQNSIIEALVGDRGALTAVGDHRQAIYGWRGGRVELMAELFDELAGAPRDSEIVELTHNFRSCPRIIDLSNRWSETIGQVRSMTSPAMEHGRTSRLDQHATHVAAASFAETEQEADWIANTIDRLVSRTQTGAVHDVMDGERGIGYSDIAILLRSSTDARTFAEALRARGIPAICRAGPELFTQPEVLLFLAALAAAAGVDELRGGAIPNTCKSILQCDSVPSEMIAAACRELRQSDVPLSETADRRLQAATSLLASRLVGERIKAAEVTELEHPPMREYLLGGSSMRRVFPQELFQLLMGEAGVSRWDYRPRSRCESAMFHLGQLSTLIKGMETPGWTSPSDLKYQMIALCVWGSRHARTEEAPLLVMPDAVSIGTIHGAKGLEFPVVFLADVKQRRFPSQFARRKQQLPFDGPILKKIDPEELADNENLDSERRLMYVALTRAERFLFVTKSGRTSKFHDAVTDLIEKVGGTRDAVAASAPTAIRQVKTTLRHESRLVTSFSDQRWPNGLRQVRRLG